MNMPTVCLVTSTHVSYNPRLTKEADTLAAAGYNVRVVAMNVEKWRSHLDEELMRSREWSLERINGRRDLASGFPLWARSAVRQRRARRSNNPADAYSRYRREMFRAAARKPADLYIAHNLPALPAAVEAAQEHAVKIGFDAEDFHRGEIANVPANRAARALIEAIETKYMPMCDYVTAASDGIGDAYVRELGIAKPTTLLNVFAKADRAGRVPANELEAERRGPGLSLYWYSQVIGPDRGLNDALKAVALLSKPAHLHVRGSWAPGYQRIFEAELGRLGIQDRVSVLPPAPPAQLVQRAAQHDVGLALEPGDRPNNRLASSNKLFTYMLAGLAIAATDVPGQALVEKEALGCGFLYPPQVPEILASKLREWQDHPELLGAAKETSRRHADNRYCWDVEREKFLKVVATALARE